MNGADFPTDGSCLLAAPHNLAIRLCLDPLAFPLRLVALGVRTFNLCLLALLLIAVFSVLIIQFRFRIGYPSAKVSQINGPPHENGLDTAPLAFICAMHVIEEKKFLALLIRQVKGTCTSSLLALSRSVDDVRRLRLHGR